MRENVLYTFMSIHINNNINILRGSYSKIRRPSREIATERQPIGDGWYNHTKLSIVHQYTCRALMLLEIMQYNIQAEENVPWTSPLNH